MSLQSSSWRDPYHGFAGVYKRRLYRCVVVLLLFEAVGLAGVKTQRSVRFYETTTVQPSGVSHIAENSMCWAASCHTWNHLYCPNINLPCLFILFAFVLKDVYIWLCTRGWMEGQADSDGTNSTSCSNWFSFTYISSFFWGKRMLRINRFCNVCSSGH